MRAENLGGASSSPSVAANMMLRSLTVLAIVLVALPAQAQQKIGFIDSDQILSQMPEFQTAQQELDRAAGQWQAEVAALDAEAAELADEFAAREILYTEAERETQLAAIQAKRTERDALRTRYFGPEGELFREQQTRLRPAQERLTTAVEAVATDGEFDYVFDRSGDYLFLYTRPRHNLTDLVKEELGIGVGATAGTRR